MTTFISIKSGQLAVTVKLVSGLEFGIPPGFDAACNALQKRLSELWKHCCFEDSPKRRVIDLKLEWSPAGFWSRVVHDRYSSTLTKMSDSEIVRYIGGCLWGADIAENSEEAHV